MSKAERSFRHLPRAGRVDAAGVDRDPVSVAAEQPPQRQVAATCMEVPDRKIDSGDRLREWSGLATLQRQYRRPLRQGFKDIEGLVRDKSCDRRREDFVDQARPVLRAGRWKIGP